MPRTASFTRTSTALLAALLTLVLLDSARAATVHGQGVLWRIDGAGAAPSHVFGTIHSDDPRVLDLPTAVETAFDDAERYAFELDFRQNIQARMARAMFDRDPPTLGEQLDAETWRQARSAGAGLGLPESTLSVMKPWALAITLAVPPIDPNQMLDRVLFDRANSADAPITGLERAAEQIDLFDGLPQEQQLQMLRGVLDLHANDRLAPMFESLTEAWLERDLAELMRISEANPMLPDNERNEAFQRRVVDERNERMVVRMEPLLEEGGAFVAIGALHLPGERGILRLLEERGYSVEPVE